MKRINFYIFTILALMGFEYVWGDSLRFNYFVTPYVYVFFILILPFEIRYSLLLLLSCTLGLLMDTLDQTWGLHGAACVCAAHWRFLYLRAYKAQNYVSTELNSIWEMRLGSMASYIFTVVLIHHSVLFFLEAFSFTFFLETLLRILLSTLVSSLLIFCIVLLDSRFRQKR